MASPRPQSERHERNRELRDYLMLLRATQGVRRGIGIGTEVGHKSGRSYDLILVDSDPSEIVNGDRYAEIKDMGETLFGVSTPIEHVALCKVRRYRRGRRDFPAWRGSFEDPPARIDGRVENRLVVIDGRRLAELMIDFGRDSVVATYTDLELDDETATPFHRVGRERNCAK